MKIIYRIPAKEPYGYIEIEDDVSEGFFDPEKMQEQYKTFKATFDEVPGNGLTGKEVDLILDGWFQGKGVTSDLYDKRNQEQDKWFQAIKRSLARIKRRGNEDEVRYEGLDPKDL